MKVRDKCLNSTCAVLIMPSWPPTFNFFKQRHPKTNQLHGTKKSLGRSQWECLERMWKLACRKAARKIDADEVESHNTMLGPTEQYLSTRKQSCLLKCSYRHAQFTDLEIRRTTRGRVRYTCHCRLCHSTPSRSGQLVKQLGLHRSTCSCCIRAWT